MTKPTIGSIVLYGPIKHGVQAMPAPAIVTMPCTDGTVDIICFEPDEIMSHYRVPYSPTVKAEHWTWPGEYDNTGRILC